VFAGVRRLQDADELVRQFGDLIRPVIIDVTNDDTIAAAVEQVRATLKQTDRQVCAACNSARQVQSTQSTQPNDDGSYSA